jgi:hypothetical protein
MVGPTLIDIRERIEALATEGGRYYVVCGRTGDRPVPATGKRFPDRATARAAARATEQYRSALRRYDPQVPFYDLVVCEGADRDVTASRPDGPTPGPPRHRLSEPVVTGDGATPERRDLVEFCHRAAGAVFESLSEAGYDGVERAVMDAYVELAETVDDADELCLCLLESMAAELDDRLAPADQAEVLVDAAGRLESPTGGDGPLDATLAALGRRGFVESYTRSPWSVDLDGGSGAVVVQFSGYALTPRDDRLPVLPLTLELCRHRPAGPPRSVRVTAADEAGGVTVVLADAGERRGLVSAPVDGGA